MDQKKWYQIFVRYVRQNLSVVLAFFAFIEIFGVMFRLYDLEMEALWYASALCFLSAIVVGSVRFFFCVREHRERMLILKNIHLLTDELPEPKTLAEEDLQEMLRELKHILEVSETGRENDQRESMDYYTTWVHQIKTPISTMKMLLDSEDTDQNRELLAELFRVEQYVEMVLSYLRLGSKTSDYVFREYELDVIIRQAIHKYAPQFVRRRIGLHYSPADVKVLTDAKWLLFIIEQVLSNSIKYTFHGSVTIKMTPGMVLQIADTGIGIAPEDIPRIFEKGFTGYNGRSEKKSTGLGLYLCKMAADRLSHKISAQSVPGKGTVIFIDLHTDQLPIE